MEEQPEFLRALEKRDKEFAELIARCMEMVLKEGALSKKIKILMMMAIDASADHEEGVWPLAKMAMECGASEKEITETLEVSAVSKLLQGLETGAKAFRKR
jgi:alkylhydroperoxidase/carboxymuconolactone decarboxylase family protein YurZ